MNDLERPRLLTVAEFRQLIGEKIVGRDLAYALARRYGVRLGKRLLIPMRVAHAFLEGRLEELEKTPGVEARGR
ncbi:hypothetical protein [Thermus sp.]|uniref:hypothetical protein n=1 Tax=Thermus sp. TaxID=275 RepID=UPI003D149E26